MDFASPKLRPYNGPNLLLSGKSLLQTWASIIKIGNFITKWGNYYCKVGQLSVIKNLSKSHYKEGQVIYFKVWQMLQSGVTLLQSGAVIPKWATITRYGSTKLTNDVDTSVTVVIPFPYNCNTSSVSQDFPKDPTVCRKIDQK